MLLRLALALHFHLSLILFLSVPGFQLMSNSKNQHDIFSVNPTIFSDVAEPAARQYQLTSAVFGLAAKQRMIREQIERSPNAEHPLTCKPWVVVREEVEQALEIRERSSRYLDARHVRARGRRAVFPSTRASR